MRVFRVFERQYEKLQTRTNLYSNGHFRYFTTTTIARTYSAVLLNLADTNYHQPLHFFDSDRPLTLSFAGVRHFGNA